MNRQCDRCRQPVLHAIVVDPVDGGPERVDLDLTPSPVGEWILPSLAMTTLVPVAALALDGSGHALYRQHRCPKDEQ
jgi:hypothetical protein